VSHHQTSTTEDIIKKLTSLIWNQSLKKE
jgi:hypothetical protein